MAAGFEPNPSRRYGESITRLAVVFAVVDGRPAAPDSFYRLRYQVVADPGEIVARGDTTVARTGGRTATVIRPAMGPIPAGTYRLELELVSPLPPPARGKKAVPIHREKPFTVEASAATLWADPRASLDVLRYIATDQEIAEMDALRTNTQQREFWNAFWKRRDPSPETPENERMDEFYKRVQYANQHFGLGSGWRTDMGRIYIVNGQPDEVVRNPFNVDRPPEEIWYYYRDRKTFVFIDKDGFGRYELDPARSR
jgi:GWxTD domain-containing protein